MIDGTEENLHSEIFRDLYFLYNFGFLDYFRRLVFPMIELSIKYNAKDHTSDTFTFLKVFFSLYLTSFIEYNKGMNTILTCAPKRRLQTIILQF